LLSFRQRVPVTASWESVVAKKFRDEVLAELERSAPDHTITASEWAALDQVYFAACGLSLAYSWLGANAWIDETVKDFVPLVSGCRALQRSLQDALGRLGIDKRPDKLDVFGLLYAQVARPSNGPLPAQVSTGGVPRPPSGPLPSEPAPAAPEANGAILPLLDLAAEDLADK
jgi:hypothetical protein